MSEPLISILICTIPKRDTMFRGLIEELFSQQHPEPNGKVQILWDKSEHDSIGEKRNRLLDKAQGKYLAFIDDDDKVCRNYINLLLEAAEYDCDCASLKGEYSIDGKFDGIFEHSIKYDKWETTDGEIKYLRHPNHLNAIRSSIAKQFKFPEKNFSEDFDWSTAIHKAGVLKSEHYIDPVIYYYNYVTDKTK